MKKLMFLFALFLSFSAMAEKPNVVLLIVDTLRADRLPMYGYAEQTTPFLNSLAEQGIVYQNAFSTSSWTAPATASVLTSLYPWQHGILMGRRSTRKLNAVEPSVQLNKIPEAVMTVAEVFKSAGYTTFGATDNGNIREDAGFAQGFDHFQNFQNQGGEHLNKHLFSWETQIRAAKPYFLYMQYMDPHHPYLEHEPWFQGKDLEGTERIERAYISEIHYVDQIIKEAFEHFGWSKNTIIALTSDHGEEFGEHGRLGHGKTLFSEVVRVPLLVYYPDGGVTKRVVVENVSNLDVVPTLTALADLKVNYHHEGVNIAQAKIPERPIFSHLWKQRKKGGEILQYATVLNNLRYYKAASGPVKVNALFDVSGDHLEKKNIIAEQQETAKQLENKFLAFESSSKKYEREWAPVNQDEEDDGSE